MSTDDFLMPTSHVAELNPDGTGAMYFTAGRAATDRVYVYLPIGVSTIQVSWNGAAQIRAQVSRSGVFTHIVGSIPTGTAGAVRMMSFQVSVDEPNYRLNLNSSSEGPDDINHRAGVVVIPISPPQPAGGGVVSGRFWGLLTGWWRGGRNDHTHRFSDATIDHPKISQPDAVHPPDRTKRHPASARRGDDGTNPMEWDSPAPSPHREPGRHAHWYVDPLQSSAAVGGMAVFPDRLIPDHEFSDPGDQYFGRRPDQGAGREFHSHGRVATQGVWA